jgi:hypothetical protein
VENIFSSALCSSGYLSNSKNWLITSKGGVMKSSVLRSLVVLLFLALPAAPASALTLTEVAKLTAIDGTADDLFGISVALYGDTAVVGAFWADAAGVTDSGAAYVFTRSGTTWTQQAKLVASDGAAYDYFGRSVALAGDTAVVGAYAADAAGATNAGAAYVFTRSGDSWTQQAKLVASDGTLNDLFGISVALAGDTAVVGAYLADAAGVSNAGAAYVFALANTPTGGDVTVQPVDPNTGTSPVTVTYADVTSSGDTTLTSSGTGPPPPQGFKLGNPPVYYTIETTAEYDGKIQICINYGDGGIAISYGNERNLKLFHETATGWENATDPDYPDTENDIICGTVTSLSVFAGFENYTFTGFLPPLENPPALNTAKAGQTVPVKWQLTDGSGYYFSNLSAVTGLWYRPTPCAGATENVVPEADTSGNSGLHYDSISNQFVFTWKTDKTMAGNCFAFILELYGFDSYEADIYLK